MRPDDELWSPLWWLRASDAEFAHAVIEGRAIKAEAGGGSVGTTDDPVQFSQYAKNVIAFDGFESCRSVSMIWRLIRMLQLGERDLETGTARQDNASLDKILQLPDVSRPVVACQRGHCLFRNA